MKDEDFIGNRALNDYTSMKNDFPRDPNWKQPRKVPTCISTMSPGQPSVGKYVFPTELPDTWNPNIKE